MGLGILALVGQACLHPMGLLDEMDGKYFGSSFQFTTFWNRFHLSQHLASASPGIRDINITYYYFAITQIRSYWSFQ